MRVCASVCPTGFNGGVNGGGFTSPNWLETSPPVFPGQSPAWWAGSPKPEPIVYVAVADSVGNWVYRMPADEAEAIWPGIARKVTRRMGEHLLAPPHTHTHTRMQSSPPHPPTLGHA